MFKFILWNHITFHEKAASDELYYYLREHEGSEDERDRLELAVGSFSTGDRIYLTNHGVKHDDEQFGHLYQRYFFWRKVDPDDQYVVIASTSRERTFNILDNSRDDGAGYQSPMDLDITLTTYGLIVLTPVYPGHKRQDLLPRLE